MLRVIRIIASRFTIKLRILLIKLCRRCSEIMDSKYIPGVSNRELYYLANNTDKAYNLIKIPKKNGGIRKVYAPKPNLKWCQHYIVNNYLDTYSVSKYATAYKKGASILANASPHVGKKYLLKIDVENFFGNIGFCRVYEAFYRQYPADVSRLFAELCCYRESLVQGSPASPKLSNIVMIDFDNAIGKWCNERGITYTRYCDDLTFSSNQKLHGAYHKAKNMLNAMGFKLNNKKTHFVNCCHQQNVTGIVVNEKPQVSAQYKRRLRQEIYYCNKFGTKSHIEHLGLNTDEKSYIQMLTGKVNFVLSINPNDSEFVKLKEILTGISKKV